MSASRSIFYFNTLVMGWSHTGTKTVLGRSQHWFRLASSWPSYDVPGMMICMHAKPSWEWHSVILRRSQDRLGKVLQLKISLAPSWDRLGKLPGLIQWWLTDGSSQDHLERLSSILLHDSRIVSGRSWQLCVTSPLHTGTKTVKGQS